MASDSGLSCQGERSEKTRRRRERTWDPTFSPRISQKSVGLLAPRGRETRRQALAPRRPAIRQSGGRDWPRTGNQDRPRLPDSRSLPHAGTPTFPWSSPPSAPHGLEETRQFPRMLHRSGYRRSRRPPTQRDRFGVRRNDDGDSHLAGMPIVRSIEGDGADRIAAKAQFALFV